MTERGSDRTGQSQLRTADFDYDLPVELIAQSPLEKRDASRLLVIDRETDRMTHSHVADLRQWLRPGDLLVVNNSRVLPSRLRGVRLPGGGAVQLLLLRREQVDDRENEPRLRAGCHPMTATAPRRRPMGTTPVEPGEKKTTELLGAQAPSESPDSVDEVWLALAKPAKRMQPGTRLEFPARHGGIAPLAARILENLGEGQVLVELGTHAHGVLEAYGTTPLPPYISHTLADDERYQTVYNKEMGSAAAPTAGLHFTRELLTSLGNQGIGWTEITLHVGLDTFRPVMADRIQDHVIHREWFQVPLDTSRAIARTRAKGGRIVAVGTTVARTLETIGREWDDENPRAESGMTDTFIVPGHRWMLVDGLLTNFHLPRSSLLMLVSAFATRELILRAYAEAIESQYRFFSFGDAMLIL